MSINTTIVIVFQKDISRMLVFLDDFINNFNIGHIEDNFYEEFISSLQNVRGGSKLLGLDSITNLTKTWEEFIEAIKLHRLHITSLDENFFSAIDKIYKSLIEQPADKIQEVYNILEPVCQNAIKDLEQNRKQFAINTPPAKSSVSGAEYTVDETMFDLFRTEVETQINILNNALVELENEKQNAETLEVLMRAAHSIKGAARVVNLDSVVKLAHIIEDIFVGAQHHLIVLDSNRIDLILKSLDILIKFSKVKREDLNELVKSQKKPIEEAIATLSEPGSENELRPKKDELEILAAPQTPTEKTGSKPSHAHDRVLRVTAQNLNRLMELAGESLVESRWLNPFSNSLMKLKKDLNEMSRYLNYLREAASEKILSEIVEMYLADLQRKSNEFTQKLSDRLAELDMFILRYSSLSDRLYREVIDSRMRPFADGIEGFPRMARDIARELGKKVRLEIKGKSTAVDREILQKLETPLGHLIRNAIDHGIEFPDERIKAGKAPEGLITLEAQHRAGMLAIAVSDDGRGADYDSIRAKVIAKNLLGGPIAANLSESEILDFLFLPGFSTASKVTDISGRGVGLDIVLTMVQEVSGTVRTTSTLGKGMTFNLLLPLTLSVIRALMVEISGEPYAFPLARIDKALVLNRDAIEVIENKQYIKFEGQNIGLIHASQILGVEESRISTTTVPIIILSDRMNFYGVVVDKFTGEKELVVHELDPKLGKIPGVNSGALMEDGSPLLIVDIDDLMRSIDDILSGGLLHKLVYAQQQSRQRKKRILVIDDSITVREVEVRFLQDMGYDVHSAINGIDGWNALRLADFDMVITDVDMPRMNGIELVKLIRSDPKLRDIPIMIVSYADRESDRMQGLEAGANYFLPKSSFQDQTIYKVILDLIGPA